MNKKNWVKMVLTLVVCVGMSVGFFQNCASPLSEEDALTSLSASEVPFAYDLKVDRLAYMSCDSSKVEAAGGFSFKVAAQDEGSGIKFRDEFLKYSGSTNAKTLLSKLVVSPDNLNARVQVAIRGRKGDIDKGLLHTIAMGSGRVNFKNLDIALASEAVIAEMLEKEGPERVRFFDNMPGLGPRSFSVSIPPPKAPAESEEIKTAMLTQLQVAVGFTNQELGTANPIGPDLSKQFDYMYGQGLKVFFDKVGVDDGSRRVLSNVVEADLVTATEAEGYKWVCPTAQRFLVVRKSDYESNKNAVTPLCNGIINRTTDVYGQDAVRQLVDPIGKYWHVDTAGGSAGPCIISKQEDDSCYSEADKDKTINYSGDGTCRDDDTGNACPHYVSICYRTKI